MGEGGWREGDTGKKKEGRDEREGGRYGRRKRITINRQTDEQTDRQRDRCTDKQTDRDRQMRRWMNGWTDKQTHRQTDE